MWSAGGYAGTGNVNGLIGSLTEQTAIVAGNAEGVFKELKQLFSILGDTRKVVFAVNDVGMYLPNLDHWVSIHIQNFPAWLSVRKAHKRLLPKIHSINYGAGINYAWVGVRPIFVLSGYFAMQLAYIMGAERIILCGCPGSPSRRFFDVEERDFGYGNGDTWVDPIVRKQLVDEMERLPEFKSKVRSMSGFTREFFGGTD